MSESNLKSTLKARQIYAGIIKKKSLIIFPLIALILISIVVNLFVGSADYNFTETIDALLGTTEDEVSMFVIWGLRMPVALSAVVIGAALGMGGCEMQTVLRNPMASPYTLGLSSAASLGAAIAIILKLSIVPGVGTFLITINSFIFSLLAAGMLYLFSKREDADRNTLILFGIVMNFLFSSLTQLLQFVADASDLQSLVFWSFGSLNKIDWIKLLIITIVTILCAFVFSRNIWKLTAMSLSDESAISLGVDVKKTRRNIIFIVALLTATAVSFAGTIGFVGLVAPHIARILCGEEQRYFLTASALIGALLLSVASIVSKSLVPGVIIPIGLVTSLIGIPFFALLILKRKG
ncbi:FecCD family ABC transporter permease [Dehalobacterium formicoaceticum]|uniref:Iron ABC transporter permease n=1 Tax=Dehalobacterium formicoaceticum TaxID=51515 RepID=A0ABT1Y0G0_9FIRM|nr:iron ABC transporter permease [Dehalobacterium formicoaceticum]MCR6544353.1 iron ABC transporter permease [Dehalobacterium formicoaceticum]